MNIFTKSLVGTVAAGAIAMTSASPAHARNDRGGISAGEVIAGALIIGGIAAIASASSRNDRDRYGYGGRYQDDPRRAVEMCVRTAESQASRVSWGRHADVTDIRRVQNTRHGYTVRGRIAVNTMNRAWRPGDNRYGRGWGGDYRGHNSRLAGYDSGNFTCKVEYGRVTDLRFSGIRGLR